MAINHGGKMGPAVLPTRNMRHVHRPPFITAAGSADPAVHARPRGTRPLMDQPPLLLQHPIHRLLVHDVRRLATQECPEMSIAEGRMLLNQLLESLDPGRVQDCPAPSNPPHTVQPRTPHGQNPATPPFRDTRQCRSHASDVFRSKGYGFNASRKISLSRTRSPIFCFSFLICSSFTASSSFGRVRSAFSAPTRNFSRQSSTSATVSPCVRAASATDVSPFKILTTSATRRLAVHRSIGSVAAVAISPPPQSTQDHVVGVVSISRGAGYARIRRWAIEALSNIGRNK